MEKDTDKTTAAWKRFIANGYLNDGDVREHTYRAWKRSHAQGCSPTLMKAETLSADETRKLLDEKKDFLEAARPYLRSLSRAAGKDRHAAMLGDEKAVVLEIIGDEETVRDTTFPAPGTLLSEALAGANGIGSPLAENTYVELVGAEHYIEGFHCYTCQGLPLRGPDGELMGVLSTSVRKVETSQRIKEILVCAAHGVEAELQRKRLEEDIKNVITNYKKDDAPLEELRQDITQLQSAARIKLEMATRLATSSNKSEKVLEYVKVAESFAQIFKDRARLWKELVTEELSSPEPIMVKDKIEELVSLLETEATTRKISVTHSLPDLKIITDAKDFSRKLFRALLTAFETAGPEGEIKISINHTEKRSSIFIEVITCKETVVSTQQLKIDLMDSKKDLQ